MITTISLNPSIDRTMEVGRLNPGGINRVLSHHNSAGGKGINVALTATALGLDAQCIGFMYKDGSKLFEKRLMVSSTAYNFIWCEGSVRTNLKIRDRESGLITEINEPGEPITPDLLKKMDELVALHAENSDYIVFTGSLPPGCPDDYYGRLIESVRGMGCRCVLDAEGPPMAASIPALPYMIKPNLYELELLTGKKLESIQAVRNAAFKFIKMGIEVVAVSMGDQGAVITNGEESYYAPKINIDVKSTVGAGDAMVAALVYGLMGERDLKDVLRMGVACGTARCAQEPAKGIDRTVYKAFLDMVQVEKI